MLHKKECEHVLIRYYKSTDYVSYLASTTTCDKKNDKNNQPIISYH
jgi:hypothetical protein